MASETSPDDVTASARPATGEVVVTDGAISDIVGWTVLECYGVVGMAPPGRVRGVASLLARDKLHHGIRVSRDADRLVVDLYIVVEYGLNVAEVGGNVRSQVQYNLERALGRPVTDIRIHVQGVRLGEG